MSGRQQGESDGIGKRKSSSKSGRAGKSAPRDRGVRKQRASELGRALRSIYDDTLRESVPDDFMDLLGKLS
ncbi:MAG TPA: NepR family anti-sigma factor [Sphingomicrobium sp.]|nr:NepR family anti-sigma factor [Sphingomicrobium sp.]